jgi:hypothetical protein
MALPDIGEVFKGDDQILGTSSIGEPQASQFHAIKVTHALARGAANGWVNQPFTRAIRIFTRIAPL